MFCGIPQAKAEAEKEQAGIPEMTVTELKQVLDSGADNVLLLDVRNPNEYEIANIPGAVLVPLPDIESGEGVEQVKELLNGHQLIVHCKMGGRSAKALGIASLSSTASKALTSRAASWPGARKSIPPCRNTKTDP